MRRKATDGRGDVRNDGEKEGRGSKKDGKKGNKRSLAKLAGKRKKRRKKRKKSISLLSSISRYRIDVFVVMKNIFHKKISFVYISIPSNL